MPTQPNRPAADDDEEEDRPRAKRRARDDDENSDDERPRAKKRRRDEDDDRPRRRKKSKDEDEEKGLLGNVYLRVGVLLLILAVLSLLLFLKYSKKDEAVASKPDVDDVVKPNKPDPTPKKNAKQSGKQGKQAKDNVNIPEAPAENFQPLRRDPNSAERDVSANNLKEVLIALLNYHEANRSIPLQSSPKLSWRVAVLPYLNNSALFKEFKHDEPWDSEHNKKLIAQMPPIFAPPKSVSLPTGQTFMQMVIGPKAMHPGLTFKDITDGMSNTIALAEASQPVIWTKAVTTFCALGDEMPTDLKKEVRLLRQRLPRRHVGRQRYLGQYRDGQREESLVGDHARRRRNASERVEPVTRQKNERCLSLLPNCVTASVAAYWDWRSVTHLEASSRHRVPTRSVLVFIRPTS